MNFDSNYKFLGNIDVSENVLKLVNEIEHIDWSMPDVSRNELPLKDGKCIVFPYVISSGYTSTYSYITNELCKEIVLKIGEFYKDCVFIRGEVAALLPGVKVLPHIDTKFFHKFSHRVHVPIKTNQYSNNVFKRQEKHFELFSIYEINNRVMHHAYNNGDTPRIHLIFDLMPASLFSTLDKNVLTTTAM